MFLEINEIDKKLIKQACIEKHDAEVTIYIDGVYYDYNDVKVILSCKDLFLTIKK